MADPVSPLDVPCDAPPYQVVKACRGLGFQAPEDVRWTRLSRALPEEPSWAKFLPRVAAELLLRRWPARGAASCSCGRDLPALERYTFTYRSGRQASFLLGQCLCCRAMYWETAP
jgi:hypothetical protein